VLFRVRAALGIGRAKGDALDDLPRGAAALRCRFTIWVDMNWPPTQAAKTLNNSVERAVFDILGTLRAPAEGSDCKNRDSRPTH
jgi:hypothetical protein